MQTVLDGPCHGSWRSNFSHVCIELYSHCVNTVTYHAVHRLNLAQCQCCRSLVGFLGAWKNITCLLWTVSFLWHVAATWALIVLAAFLVLLELLVALTYGYLVSNNAIRGIGGNHGVHSACVSSFDSFATTLTQDLFQLVAIMVYFLFENLLGCTLISWWN